jgi:hypothetical protein
LANYLSLEAIAIQVTGFSQGLTIRRQAEGADKTDKYAYR